MLVTKHPQLAKSVIMVYPHDFGFNSETGQDNEFQHKPDSSQSAEISRLAKIEFEAMVESLQHKNIEVLLLDNKPNHQKLPDALFPNNWFSTRNDGSLFIYPMKTPNRQAEVQTEALIQLLDQHHYPINKLIDIRETIGLQQGALEGTGSLIFHHPSASVFAAISERCNKEALSQFCENFDFHCYPFHASTQQGTPIYHSNVLMSCGQDFAVVTQDTIANTKQSQHLIGQLAERVTDIIIITEQQMSQHFCANILQINDINQHPCIVMSSSAYQGFTATQRRLLERHGSLIICDIPTIEHVGGGSARCMLAENFLIKQ